MLGNMLKKFIQARPVIQKIEEAGYEAYFVGGSVRDYLLQKPIHDVDIATSAFPEEVKNIFPKTVDVGIEHGTVIAIFEGEHYEITSFRTEKEYIDYRRPKEVTFVRSLSEDLKRRDFTMNAIAMTKEGDIIDPYLGQQDIQNGIIRTVGESEERFTEDALRIMRAVRFVSQLSFQLEENTFNAIKEFGPLLQHISVERIYAEFDKLLAGKNRNYALKLIAEQHLHQYLPGLSRYKNQLIETAQLVVDDFSVMEIWALLLIVIDQVKADEFLRKWKMPGKSIKTIKLIFEAYQHRKQQAWTKELVYYTGKDISISTEKIYAVIHKQNSRESVLVVDEIYKELPIKSRDELDLTGNDLLNWETKLSGPWIRERIEEVEKAVLNGSVRNEKKSIKEWLYS